MFSRSPHFLFFFIIFCPCNKKKIEQPVHRERLLDLIGWGEDDVEGGALGKGEGKAKVIKAAVMGTVEVVVLTITVITSGKKKIRESEK